MTRAAYRVDRNQREIIDALREAGCSVQIIAMIGSGAPDILVGFRGRNLLAEIKADGRARLTPDEVAWHQHWRGDVRVWRSVEDALSDIMDDAKELPY